MIGTLVSLGGYLVVLFVLVIWMVIKIARTSPLLAVLTFFFWPAAIIALAKNWGDEENDIKIPFLLAIVTTGAIFWASNRVVDKAVTESAGSFTAAEIEEIRRSDPELAQRIETARATAPPGENGLTAEDRAIAQKLGYSDEDLASAGVPGAGSGDGGGGAAAAPTAAATKALVQEAGAEKRARLRQATGGLKPRRGTIRLARAGAVLDLPQHFRFIARDQLMTIAELHGEPLTRETLGWITHERVNVGADRIWYVEARFERGVAANATIDPTAPMDFSRIDALAPAKDGAVRYVYHGAEPLPRELGERATRLMAARTKVGR